MSEYSSITGLVALISSDTLRKSNNKTSLNLPSIEQGPLRKERCSVYTALLNSTLKDRDHRSHSMMKGENEGFKPDMIHKDIPKGLKNDKKKEIGSYFGLMSIMHPGGSRTTQSIIRIF